jgi:serine protease Do
MKTKKFLSVFLIGFAGGIFALASTFVISKVSEKRVSIQPEIPAQYANYSGVYAPTGIDFTKSAELSVHGVVHIKTEYDQKNSMYDDFFGSWDPWGFFGNGGNQGSYAPITASGSGVIISEDGYIATNNHVVQDASKIEVTLNDKRTYVAEIIGTDPATDLALIKIDEKELPYLPYGNSDSVKVGEWVLAVGNPFNLTSTVTAGIISAKARNINILGKNSSIESFLQTDAAVNPGNSGGALVNTNGQLIGINAAIASNTGSYTGYSFAIPVNIVRKVMNDLLQFGKVQRAYLGVTFEEIDSKFAKEKNIDKVKGIYITAIDDDGSAKNAGIVVGDIITKIGNSAINSSSELQEAVATHSPGDKVTVSYTRDGKDKEVIVTLKNISGTTDIVKKDETTGISLLGASFEVATKEELRTLGLEYGIKVSKLETGLLKSAGVKEGFIITSVDKKAIKSIDDLQTALADKKGGVLIEGFYPNGMRAYYGFGM